MVGGAEWRAESLEPEDGVDWTNGLHIIVDAVRLLQKNSPYNNTP